MAKIVVAGCSDCPYFAKVELLADNLKINVPNFHVHKIVKTRKEWSAWSSELTKANNWNIKESPIIWRELVDRGGKGHLIGGANEFQEYVKCYYNIISDFTSQHMQDIALDNIKFKEDEDREIREFKALSTPTKVAIVGAMNESVPHFVISLSRGDVINTSTELALVFLDKTTNLSILKSLQMGTFDLAYPLVRSISITDNAEAALADSSIVVIFDERTEAPEESEQLNDWMKANQEYYEFIGNVIDKYCLFDVKVVLVPTKPVSFVNIHLTSMHRMLQRISKFNVVGLSRGIEQHVRSVVAKKLSVNPSNVHNNIVWGNIGGKTFHDVSNSRVHQYDGSVMGPEPFSLAVEKTIWDKKWMKNEMNELIVKRFQEISDLNKGFGSPLALASAVTSFLRQWINGDENGYIHSLIIASEGWYGVPEGMPFSMPVTLNPRGYWTVIQDIALSEEQFKKINECIQDIVEKTRMIYPWMNNNNQSDLGVDEAFIDSQIDALLQEIYPKTEISSIKALINSSPLLLEDKIDMSKSKELLMTTISDLRKSQSAKEPATEKPEKSDSKQIEPNIILTVNNNSEDIDKNSVHGSETSEHLITDQPADDPEDQPADDPEDQPADDPEDQLDENNL